MHPEKVKEVIKAVPAFAGKTDLASEKLGGRVIFATDDFFAEKENLIKSGRGVFIFDKYTERGKWMDGWESRRKRSPGNDWCIIKLAVPGQIFGVDIDTNHFLGNHPPFASVQACQLESDINPPDWDNNVSWIEILSKSPLDAGSRNFFEISEKEIFTHVRLNIYPDGGVARFRVYGEVHVLWNSISADEIIDLASAKMGGKAIACNDMFFSSMDNLLLPGRGINMGDGWETKRNRTPGNKDWVIIRLGTVGTIERILVDTAHFKGNYPDTCMIEGCLADNDQSVLNNDNDWQVLLPQQKLSADKEHNFQIDSPEKYSHIRLSIFPDGGISRLRVYGKRSL